MAARSKNASPGRLNGSTARPTSNNELSNNAPSNNARSDNAPGAAQHAMARHEWFGTLAHETARWAGTPAAFIVCVLFVLGWGLTGPLFHYSDTWQLVINTSTTIITFLMVFLIQNTQNRDTMALQIKLAELIRAVHGAKNRLATAEDLSEKDLEALHQEYRVMADQALERLEKHRSGKKGQSEARKSEPRKADARKDEARKDEARKDASGSRP